MADNLVSIKVEHLKHLYPARGRESQPVLANDDLSFEVNRGEIFGLLGPNGAGKTTLILQLIGLLAPSSGSIWIEGIDVVSSPDKVKTLASYLPQSGLPMRYTTVEQALFFTGRLRGQKSDEAKKQARDLIEELEMGPYAGRAMNKLSGGMAHLANFAMALMAYPRVLVLDEPTNELDPHNRHIVWEKITSLNREKGVTCVLVTHNVVEAEGVIQRVAVIQQGKLIALGTPGELKQRNGGLVRLEFHMRDGEAFTADDYMTLAPLCEIEEVRGGQYRLYMPQKSVGDVTSALVSEIGLQRLDDFRLAPPSLEDVYLDLERHTVIREH
jgi:ABC-2 type transport system permease protein